MPRRRFAPAPLCPGADDHAQLDPLLDRIRAQAAAFATAPTGSTAATRLADSLVT